MSLFASNPCSTLRNAVVRLGTVCSSCRDPNKAVVYSWSKPLIMKKKALPASQSEARRGIEPRISCASMRSPASRATAEVAAAMSAGAGGVPGAPF